MDLMNRIRIIVADDHEIVRTQIKALLHRHVDLCVVDVATTGAEAIERTMLHKPDVVVMDVHMPGMSGIDACYKISKLFPDIRVVILTVFAEDNLLIAAGKAGAAGYVLKRIGGDILVSTIRAVVHGKFGLDPAMTEAMHERIGQRIK